MQSSSFQGQMSIDEVVGGQGQRQPSAIELDGARYQGKLIAETANRLFGG